MGPRKEDALRYHREPRPGKVEVRSTKPCLTSHDLSLAYTPGVAYPCLDIADNPDLVYDYTNKGNLVAVISNGTAVLGLGNIGPAAGKPVMEGKGVLFKRFADTDVFDIEIAVTDPDEFIEVVAAIAPTFGGINLEDVKAPECFYIEEKLRERLDIPVMHDDQHGTAIITAAAFLNTLEITGKRAEDVKIACSGAGAAGIACLDMLMECGARRENIFLCDSKGVVHDGRDDLNPQKLRFVQKTEARTLADAMKGADVFLGVSAAGVVSPEMLRTMADHPAVFAMANPEPEIDYEVARAARSDVIMATGRSDYPNQVNNVLGFPFIFRGALDVRARTINGAMKLAAARALAELARSEVPEEVRKAYDDTAFRFGPEYIIPKPFDERVLYAVAPAVALAATETGVARKPLEDVDAYREQLKERFFPSGSIMRRVFSDIRTSKPRIVFSEGQSRRVLRACERICDGQLGRPVLIGDPATIRDRAEEVDVNLDERGIEIVDPSTFEHFESMMEQLVHRRARKGMTPPEAVRLLRTDPVYFGAMMVEMGMADGLVTGLKRSFAGALRPVLRCIPVEPGQTVCAVYMIFQGPEVFFFADTAVHIAPTSEQLAGIARTVAGYVRSLQIEPRVAMLSFSSFGSASSAEGERVARAVALAKEADPGLNIDGEMQLEVAVDPRIRSQLHRQSTLKGPANVFIFPNLSAATIGFGLMRTLGGCDIIGPVLLGLERPVHVARRESSVGTLVNLAALTAYRARHHL